MKPVKFKSQWGKEYNIVFTKSTYANNNRLYIGCLCEDKEYGGYEPYCDVTVNLTRHGVLNENCAFIDTNNADPNLIKLMYAKDWINATGVSGGSGFCMYPMVEFTETFLKMIDT